MEETMYVLYTTLLLDYCTKSIGKETAQLHHKKLTFYSKSQAKEKFIVK